jgi:hypothetical protein
MSWRWSSQWVRSTPAGLSRNFTVQDFNKYNKLK